MKTFSIASDITHLIFSTSFYLDELNPVTACDPDPTTLNSLISTTTQILLTACFFIHNTTRNVWPNAAMLTLHWFYYVSLIVNLMRFVIILIKFLCTYVTIVLVSRRFEMAIGAINCFVMWHNVLPAVCNSEYTKLLPCYREEGVLSCSWTSWVLDLVSAFFRAGND